MSPFSEVLAAAAASAGGPDNLARRLLAPASAPRGKRDRDRAQEVFNAWTAETGRPLSALSLILAAATG